jgi:hypothetical protein
MVPDDDRFKLLTSKFSQSASVGSDSDSSLECTDSLFGDICGLTALDQLIDLVRMMLSNQDTEFTPDEKQVDEWLSIFGSIEENYQPCLLKEFLICENFTERLVKIQKHIFLKYVFSEVLRVKNVYEVFLKTNATDDLSEIFQNVLISCRVIPVEYQKKIYANIDEIYIRAEKIAKIHGQPWPAMESFLPRMFDFASIPISFLTAKTTEEHRACFWNTITSLSHVILKSVISFLSDSESLNRVLQLIWGSGKSGISWEEFSKPLLTKMVKQYDRRSEADLRVSNVAKNIQSFIHKESNLGYFSTLLYAFHVKQFKDRNFLGILKVFTNVFKEVSPDACNLKVILSRLLMYVPWDMWTAETLPYVRLIQKNCIVGCKNVLHEYYDGINIKNGYREIYGPDIVRGLKVNGMLWVDVVDRFLNAKKLSIPRSALSSFYAPLKVIVANADTKQYRFREVLKTFCKVASLSGVDCTDDWDIFMRDEKILKEPNESIESMLDIKHPPVNEDVIAKLLRVAIHEGLKNSKTVSGLMRIFEKSGNPSILAMSIFKELDALKYSRCSTTELWTFVLFIAEKEQTTDVHEGALALLVKKSTSDMFKVDLGVLKLMAFLRERNLISTEIYKESSETVAARAQRLIGNNSDSESDSYCVASLLAASDASYFPRKKSNRFSTLALLFQKHHQNVKLNSDQINQLTEAFKSIVQSKIPTHPRDDQYALILVEIIKEFNDEPYFGELRKFGIKQSSQYSEIHHGFAPRFFLYEALNYAKEPNGIPNELRRLLLDVDKWYTQHEWTLFLMHKELREVLSQTQKLFGTGKLDSYLVRFTACLFFLDFNEDWYFSFPILTQIAK